MRKTIKKTSLAMLAVSAIACVGLGSAAIKTVTPASATTTAEDIFMAYGASVRLADDFYGLRFKMAVTPDYFESHNTGKYGMIIIPYDYLSTYATALTNNGNDYVKTFAKENVTVLNFTDMEGYAADAKYNATTGEATYQCFNGIISSIKYNNLDRDFVAIGYYSETQIVAGNEVTTYDYAAFNEADNVRNVVEIANAALEVNATATTDVYTAEQVLRLYEYEFLNDQNAEGVSETAANDAYTAYKAGLKTSTVITNKGTKATVAQHEAVTLDTDDTLTLEFTIEDSTMAFTGDFGCGLAVGAKDTLSLDNYLYNNNIFSAMWYVNNCVVFNGGRAVYNGKTVEANHASYPNQKCGFTVSYNFSNPAKAMETILAVGNSVKTVYEAVDGTTNEGSWYVYYKTAGATEWTTGLSVTGINGEVPKDNIIMGIYMWGNGTSVNVSNYSVKFYDSSEDTTSEKAENLSGTYVDIEAGKGNTVTVKVDGEVKDTAFVRLGKAYTPDESYGITEWTVNGTAYDVTSPVMENITIEGELALPESYSLSFTTTGGEVYFSNLKPLEKGKHITLEITVDSITYDSTDTGFFAIVGDDEEVKYNNTVAVSGQSIIIQNGTVLNSGLSSSFTAGNKVIIKLVYKADSDQYFARIYLNSESSLIWIRDTTPISCQELFGVVFVNYGLDCKFTVKCYDSDGTNLGVSGSSNITVTGNP